MQPSTIKVPKRVLEDIKVYCRKAGQPVGEWVQTAWKFIERNDFDIYDRETTPFLMMPEAIEKERSQVEILCKMMGEFITNQQQAILPPADAIMKATEDKASAMSEAKLLREENERLRAKIESLEEYKQKAQAELFRIKSEQKTFGKIQVNTDF